MFMNLHPPAALVTLHTYQNGSGFVRKLRDHVPVAIKHIPRENVIYESVRKSKKMLPLEVAVMLKMAHGKEDSKSAAISLLDYYDLDQELILVLERPVPAVDLFEYMEVKEGSMQEEESRLILKQLIEAARELQSKKVFHRDIKAENILIETSTDFPRVRVIDFGLSCFSKKSSSYRIFCGTSAHIPPEWYQNKTYRASPTTVWQIGVVLYDLLHWNDRFETTSFLAGEITISKDLSPACQDMLQLCLTKDTALRPSLEELSHHPWLSRNISSLFNFENHLADTAERLFLAKWRSVRSSRSSKVPSSIVWIWFPCSMSSSVFFKPSNKPLSRRRSLLNPSEIVTKLRRSLKTPVGIDVSGLLEILMCVRLTKPAKASGPIIVVLVFINSNFVRNGSSTKASLGIVLISLSTKKSFVTPGCRTFGISFVSGPKTWIASVF
uniref:non-specific serine/threonine protein kinase n=1 Tax=Labrus bergylta TaxID=56723 RepID=A0A3Q3EBQ6_9LABR